MDLALSCPSSDGGPAQEVGNVLRRDGIKQFGGAGKAPAIDVQQNRPGQLNALSNVAGAVKVRVVDETLPTHSRSWLLEIGAHHDQQFVANGLSDGFEPVSVFVGGIRIMNGAGPTTTMRRSMSRPCRIFRIAWSRLEDQLGYLVADRQLRFDIAGEGGFNLYDMLVIDRPIHDGPLNGLSAKV